MRTKETNTKKTNEIVEKNCEKCGKLYTTNGRFCSIQCKNSRTWTEAHKKIFSDRQRAYMAREESLAHREKRRLQLYLLWDTGLIGRVRKERKNDVPYVYDENEEDYIAMPYEEKKKHISINPDEYYLIPFNDSDLQVDDGDIWEEVTDWQNVDI